SPKMPLTTLIVDDEPIARRILREELEGIRDVQIVGEADSGAVALQCIAQQRPDLVLLDLQMPVMTGLEVISHLRGIEHTPIVVVVTAYDEYVLKALDAGAIDYLLKPVRQERLAQAIERARRMTGREAIEHIARLQEIMDSNDAARTKRVVGKIGEEYFLLNTHEIYAFQAEGDLVWIIAGQRKYMATQTLRALEERLRNSSFRRIQRNA